MSTNVVIGERLRAERNRCRLTQLDLAERAGVSKTTQANYESGLRSPDADYLARADEAGLDVLYIVTGRRLVPEEDESFVVIRLLPIKANTEGVPEPTIGLDVGGMSVPRAWLAAKGLKPDNLAVIIVRGASMQGALNDGDRVLVDLQDREPRSGFIYVLRQGSELLVRHCQLLPGNVLRVSSENQAYQPYDVDLAKTEDFEVIGRVAASMHAWQ